MARLDLPDRQIAGPSRIRAALRSRVPVGLVLVRREAKDPAVAEVVELAAESGIPVRRVSSAVLGRVRHSDAPADILALVGRVPRANLAEVLEGTGAVWLLVGVTYPSNAGMAIRTAEVSGADGVIIDAGFDAAARRFALRISVRSDWYMPVLWKRAPEVLAAADRAERRVIGIEHVGKASPWEVDLTGPALFVVGGEADGIPPEVLERCHQTVRIPMAGFIPSYNLQAAVAAVAVERLRQSERIG
jgi:tRNA G18 (ribose-2'-O)-methylase SpoU